MHVKLPIHGAGLPGMAEFPKILKFSIDYDYPFMLYSNNLITTVMHGASYWKHP